MVLYKTALTIGFVLMLLVMLLFITSIPPTLIYDRIRRNPASNFAYILILTGSVLLLGAGYLYLEPLVISSTSNPALFNLEKYRESEFRRVLELLAPLGFLLLVSYRHLHTNPFYHDPIRRALNHLHPVLWFLCGMFWWQIAWIAAMVYKPGIYFVLLIRILVFMAGAYWILRNISEHKAWKYGLFCLAVVFLFLHPLYQEFLNEVGPELFATCFVLATILTYFLGSIPAAHFKGR